MTCTNHVQHVVLVAVGSFNPVTFMHLRCVERARDVLLQKYGLRTVKGIFSPASDGYKPVTKKKLAPANHRAAMLDLAVRSSDWLSVDTHECSQPEWTPTVHTLRHLANKHASSRVMLLCGSDLLNSFNIPNLWQSEHINEICTKFGIVVVSRFGFSADDAIERNDILQRHRDRILTVDEVARNDTSSSVVRECLQNAASVRYLIPDAVVEYIYEHSIYDARRRPHSPIEEDRGDQ